MSREINHHLTLVDMYGVGIASNSTSNSSDISLLREQVRIYRKDDDHGEGTLLWDVCGGSICLMFYVELLDIRFMPGLKVISLVVTPIILQNHFLMLALFIIH